MFFLGKGRNLNTSAGERTVRGFTFRSMKNSEVYFKGKQDKCVFSERY